MTGANQSGVLRQLLDLHKADQEIGGTRRELERYENEVAAIDEDVEGRGAALSKLEAELERLRLEARSEERVVDEKRDALSRIRSRVDTVQNQRQYSAATLEFDLVRQDLRSMEDRLLEKMQAIEELESRQRELVASLDEANSAAGPRRQEMEARQKELEDELAVLKDRRENQALRLDQQVLSRYDQIRTGRSEVAVAPLTDEGVCGNCNTMVTVQQQMEIKEMSTLIYCEGCGVILYPKDF